MLFEFFVVKVVDPLDSVNKPPINLCDECINLSVEGIKSNLGGSLEFSIFGLIRCGNGSL